MMLYILSDIIDINAEFLKIINFIKNNPNVFKLRATIIYGSRKWVNLWMNNGGGITIEI